MADGGFHLGKRLAPPRFILAILVFAAGLAALVPTIGWGRGTMAAFDIAAAVFLVAVSSLLKRNEATQIRRTAVANDANRVLLLAMTALITLVVLVAVHGEVKGNSDTGTVVLVIATLALAWLFSNTVYALHYAHLFYLPDDDGEGDQQGLCFPKTDEPDYWDFVYFSFTLGMTFQTSDVDIAGRGMRRVVIGQCLAAFVFNLGVLAFTINVLGGG
ncbi:DUF1345 domain-containing protein [Sphingomonas bacterium]|uniref:DUF1345 domain-containing protein n=1 Tax=Sphingomonas bacterium TaxID=1895847 RepID=UPI001577388E|nr:DUF1345 domain-containing protein [Sphingomonas bacterium]